MRLHRKTVTNVQSGKVYTDVICEFQDIVPTLKWMPARVRAKRTPGSYTATIEQIQVSTEPIDQSRFTVQSLQLPVGTAAIDKIAHRRLGYWNGKEIVEDLFSKSKRDNSSQPSRVLVLFLCLGVLSASLIVYVFRSRKLQRQ